MTTERLDIQQMVAAASGYKFDDVERQKQYERLLADLNLIVEENTFDQIWDDIGLMETFTKKLNEIMVLIEVEKTEKLERERVWTREECIEWAEEAGIENAESYVDNKFEIFDDHIEIKGDLLLRDGKTRELPVGLTTVGGDLDLYNSQIKVLPAGLTSIGGRLYLGKSQVQELPAGLTSIGGDVNLKDSQVRELPSGLTTIGGYLFLNNSQLRELPAGLTTIGRGLWLRGSQIWDINESLEIGGNVYAKGLPQSLIDKLNKMEEIGNIKGRVITT